MKQSIFFDLDGTLIDTSYRHYRVYRDILEFFKVPSPVSKEEFWMQKRQGKKTVDLLPTSCSKEFIQDFMADWLKKIESQEYLKYDKLFPETLNVLSRLKENFDLILVTLRNERENLLRELDSFGLTKFFSEIIIGSPLSKNKTDLIEQYFKATCRNNDNIIVGDSEVDVLAGKEIGIFTVAVSYGIRSREFFIEIKPNICIDNLSGIFKILQEFDNDS